MRAHLAKFKLRPQHWGAIASIALSLLLFTTAPFGLENQRELFFDTLTQIGPKPDTDNVVVVDLAGYKGDRWNRENLAGLINKIADANPSVLAFDLLFSADCGESLAANKSLASAISRTPSILGFLIGNGENGKPRPHPPLATARPLAVPDAWFIGQAETACPIFMDAAHSAAAAYLVGDSDARVRRLQAFSVIDGTAFPALSLEAVRLSSNVKTPPILGGLDLWLKLGTTTLPLSEGGAFRFVAADRETIAARTIAASTIEEGSEALSGIKGKIVFLGSSAPALGGLRESASMPLQPSVQIHADAASAISSGFIPIRDYRFTRYEALYVLLGGVFLAFASTQLQPAYLAGFGVGVIALSLGLSFAIYAATAYLADGFSVALTLAAILAVTIFFQFAHARRTERLARQRFGQYLPQSVVSRYLDGGNMGAEERQVTALFTDIEGFSALTKRMPAQEMVKLLDIYFSEVNREVANSGGMIDKVVGDAVHALFNAPEDLEGHVDAAIACARRIRSLTEEMRRRPEFAAHEFGRTRIGIETGAAVIGEVGAGGKLDYTAHGEAINLAARLQEANKFLNTSICIGPGAAREATGEMRELGNHDIRGFGALQLFTVD